MSNTFTVTLPDGRKVTRTSVRNFTHAVAYRDEDETAIADDWTLSGFRSSERLANYQAGRLRNQGYSEVVVLPVDVPEVRYAYTDEELGREVAPVQYLRNGKLVDGFGNIIAENVEPVEPEGTPEEASALDAGIEAAVEAYLDGRAVSDRARESLRESLRPAIVAAAPYLQGPAWEVGYEDGTLDEIRRPMIETGVRQATVDPYLKGAQR